MFYIKMPCFVIRDGGFHLLGHSWRGDALAVVSARTGNVQSTATAGLLSVSVSGRQASLTRCCAVNEKKNRHEKTTGVPLDNETMIC